MGTPPSNARIFFRREHVVGRFRVSGLIMLRAHMASTQIGSKSAWRARGALKLLVFPTPSY